MAVLVKLVLSLGKLAIAHRKLVLTFLKSAFEKIKKFVKIPRFLFDTSVKTC